MRETDTMGSARGRGIRNIITDEIIMTVVDQVVKPSDELK